MLNLRKKFFSLLGMHFFLIEKFSHQESCENFVLINQNRFISERDSALDSGGNSLEHLSLSIHAASLCLGWEWGLAPWDWSTDSLWDSCGPWG